MSHLDEVTLELVRLELGSEAHLLHVAECRLCQSRLDVMAREDEDFRRFVFPVTVDQVVAPPRARWWPVGALVALAAALALVVWTRPPGPPDDYRGLKGDSLGLEVYTLDGSGAPVRLASPARIPAGASLRFRVAPARPCYLWLVSLDDRAQVSRLYPPTGESPLISGAQTLPGGATLDGVAGLERLYGVCTARPVGYESVAAAAARATARNGETLSVDDAVQASLLIEKLP